MVVARKKDGRIVVGVTVADTLKNICADDLLHTDNLPFWKVKGVKDCYVFISESTFSTDLIRYNHQIFKNFTDGDSLITEVVPRLKELLYKHSCIKGKEEWESQMLILKDNRIYEIGNFFTVCETDSFLGLGYMPYTRGGIEQYNDKTIEESILFAVRDTEKLRGEKFFPLVVFDNKTKRSKVYYN
jgi:hypothetical protein